MANEDAAFMAEARFRARIDRMIREVPMADDSPPTDELTAAYETPVGAHPLDPVNLTDLDGDWSWRPDAQPVDPGYVFTAEEVLALNNGWIVPPRPWMVAAYSGRDLAPKPRRITSIR